MLEHVKLTGNYIPAHISVGKNINIIFFYLWNRWILFEIWHNLKLLLAFFVCCPKQIFLKQRNMLLYQKKKHKSWVLLLVFGIR